MALSMASHTFDQRKYEETRITQTLLPEGKLPPILLQLVTTPFMLYFIPMFEVIVLR